MLAKLQFSQGLRQVRLDRQFFIKDITSNAIHEPIETHTMRYLFTSELELWLSQLQMQIVESREWLTDRQPGLKTWEIYFGCNN